MSDTWTRCGRIKLARHWAEHGVALLDRVSPTLAALPVPLTNLGDLLFIAGDDEQGLRLMARAGREAEPFGETHLTATVNDMVGRIQLFRGDLEGAERSLATARNAAERVGSEADLYDCLATLVLLYTRSNRLTEAAAAGEELAELVQRGVRPYSADDWADTALLELRLASGPLEAAVAFGEEALAHHLAAGHLLVVLRLRTRMGLAHVALGAREAAEAYWRPALAYAVEEELPDRHILEWLLANASYSPGRPSAR